MELNMHVIGKVEAETLNEENQYTLHVLFAVDKEPVEGEGLKAAIKVDELRFHTINVGDNIYFLESRPPTFDSYDEQDKTADTYQEDVNNG